jgi:hypothetical protein
MDVPFKAYKSQKNARRITLYSLAGAIVIIAGIFALRAFLNRDMTKQSVAAEPQPAVETQNVAPVNPNAKGIPLPGTAQAQSQQLTAQQTAPVTQPQAQQQPASAPKPQTQPAQPPAVQTPAQAPAAPAVTQPASTPTTAPAANAQLSPEASKLCVEADDDLKAGKFIAARDKLSDAVRILQGSSQQPLIKGKLEQLSQMWLYNKDILKGDSLCSDYTVRPGDSLEIIGKKFKVPYEFLMQINQIEKPQSLKVGQHLKVVNGPFHAIVSRSTFTLDLYLQTTYVRSFKVGLGQDKMETPTGLWRVSKGGKMIKPKWTDPKTGKTFEGEAPDYPLGSRWIGLDGIDGNAKGRTGFAIHGTKDPQSIGTRSSQGCIRLYNGDVIMVYNMMTPIYSEVRVID